MHTTCLFWLKIPIETDLRLKKSIGRRDNLYMYREYNLNSDSEMSKIHSVKRSHSSN